MPITLTKNDQGAAVKVITLPATKLLKVLVDEVEDLDLRVTALADAAVTVEVTIAVTSKRT